MNLKRIKNVNEFSEFAIEGLEIFNGGKQLSLSNTVTGGALPDGGEWRDSDDC